MQLNISTVSTSWPLSFDSFQTGTSIVYNVKVNLSKIILPKNYDEIILKHQERTWSDGPSLPLSTLASSAATSYERRLGDECRYGDWQYQDRIFVYVPETRSFKQLGKRLKYGRTSPFAITVPDDIVTCSKKNK